VESQPLAIGLEPHPVAIDADDACDCALGDALPGQVRTKFDHQPR
jgi:hypothetical protein